MSRRMTSAFFNRAGRVGVALIAALAAGPALAEPPAPPPYYAIEKVRVVTGAGETLEAATVLLADGLIEAVGRSVEIPGDAWRIDGSELTLYPGLIDGLTTLGQVADDEESNDGPPGRRGGGDEPPIRGPEDRPQTTPWIAAADQLGEDGKIEKWRDAGFAAAISAPDKGLFTGQAALVHLGDSEPRERVLATPVGQKVTLETGGFRNYPGSLMGVIAYVKQVLSDADHYSRAMARYEAAPAGHKRPEYDRTLDPLAASKADSLPFLLPADLGREIDRAIAIGSEYGLSTVIYGGRGAYARADALAAKDLPVLVSLDWPEEEKDRDPDADTAFRDLYHRRMAVTTPKALADAGVRFAFYSDGLASPLTIFENVRQAIDAGLTSEQALAALTSDAARIFGVEDRVGTIEEGKIANLVLATGEPWAEDTEIRAVFVDGRKYEERESEEPSEAPEGDVSGTWELSLETPSGAREMTAELEMSEDGEVTGELESERGSGPIEDGRLSGKLLRFKVTREMGGRSMQASYSLELEGDRLAGTMSAGPMTMDITGERTAAADVEDDDETADEEPAVSLEELRGAMAVYQGPVREPGRFAITNATVYTVSGETIENGTVLVSSGKIRAVGAQVAVPAGFEVFDAGGGSLIPGVIDAHSHIAVDGSVNEGSLAVTAMVGIGDVLDPDDIGIYRALGGGVTTINILHGSANPIGGRNQVIKLRWGADAEGMKFEGAPAGIKFALGENPKRSNFRSPSIPQRYPQTRMGVMDVIRDAFTEAKQYQADWAAWRAQPERQRGLAPRRDFKLDALVEILEGKRLVHSHCYRADEILQLLRLAEEFGFKITTLQHVLEGYKVADEIAAHGAGASTFSDWWGYKVEAYDAIPHNAALMTERGVVASINSDSGEEMRHLNQEAAKAMKWGGLDELQALALVTLNPAKQLGIDDRVGSIEVGKDADLVLYDGQPLSLRSVVRKTFVDGVLYFDIAADRERQALIEELEVRMTGAGDEDDEAENAEDDAAAEPEPEADPEPSARRAIREQEAG